MAVRDYECDIQHIVNNAVYQNYFEHARHQFLQKNGINFLELTKAGISFVVYRSEIDYCLPLTMHSNFNVTVEFERVSKIRGVFNQTITSNNLIFTKAKFFVTAFNINKKVINLDEINIEKLHVR